MQMSWRRWGMAAGALALFFIIGLAIAVKHELLPYPVVETAEVTSRYIGESFHEFAVPNEAIVEEAGKTYVYLIKSHENYWLDGPYAYRTEIEVIDRDETAAAISPVDSDLFFGGAKQVVLAPDPAFSAVQKVYLEDGDEF